MCSIFMRYKKDELSALDKIYVATALLIKNIGYNDFNCSSIIKAANISRSTFYFYFKNKDLISLTTSSRRRRIKTSYLTPLVN